MIQRLLIEYPENRNESGFYGSYTAKTILHIAVFSQSVECVRFVLKLPKVSMLMKDSNGDTALLQALKWRHCPLEIIQELVESEFDFYDHADKNGNYPIHVAIDQNRMDCVKLFIESFIKTGKMPNDHCNSSNLNAILLAAEYRNIDLINYLMENTAFARDFGKLLECYTSLHHRHQVYYNDLQNLYTNICGEKELELEDFVDSIPNIYHLDNNKEAFGWIADRFIFTDTNPNKEMAVKYWKSLPDELSEQKDCYLKLFFLMNPKFSVTFAEKCSTIYGLNLDYFFLRDVIEWIDEKWFDEGHMIDFILSKFGEFLASLSDVKFFWSVMYLLTDYFRKYHTMHSTHSMTQFLFKAKCHQRKTMMEYFYKLDAFLSLKCERAKERLSILMPFLPVVSADRLEYMPIILENMKNTKISKNSEKFYGQQYHKEPISLANASRFAIRKMAFDSVPEGENVFKNLLLISKDLPRILKNFLLFNESRADWTAQMMADFGLDEKI